jgi:crotonobetainyl-CoA:carnitine CoA-transferase CaiB-like acyl-CoA transferase
VQFAYPAKDGFVSITHLFGSAIGPATRRLMDWVCEAGFCDEPTRDKDWVGYTTQLLSGEEPISEFERVKQALARFTASKTKAELFQGALDRGILLAPVATVRDVVESEQFAARGYFQEVERDGLRARTPGAFARFAAEPIRYRRAAPRLDEHGVEVRSELRPAAKVAPAVLPNDPRPLAGVKVLDFMWAVAGPAATRTLADYGATVVRIESTKRLDVCRTIHPFLDDLPGPERGALFHNMNVGKRMLTLDPSKPEGRAAVLDLVRWADVVTESFTPKGMTGFGLGYETLRAVKPDLIMLSTCMMGQTGPLSRFAGFGNLAAAFAGFYELTGWPDRPPAGPFGAYTDYLAPRFNACAVLAALEHRRRTGQGQHIDLSQAEAALHFLAPALLDYAVNGNLATRDGNRDAALAPHGVFPCAGEDRWVAIACRDERDRQALGEVLGTSDLSEVAIAAFTAALSPEEVEARLQAAGVPASVVAGSPECARDPQLAHRRHFLPITHPDRASAVEASRFQLSRTPARVGDTAPTFGLDSQWVLETILGYDDERIAELVIAGALE